VEDLGQIGHGQNPTHLVRHRGEFEHASLPHDMDKRLDQFAEPRAVDPSALAQIDDEPPLAGGQPLAHQLLERIELSRSPGLTFEIDDRHRPNPPFTDLHSPSTSALEDKSRGTGEGSEKIHSSPSPPVPHDGSPHSFNWKKPNNSARLSHRRRAGWRLFDVLVEEGLVIAPSRPLTTSASSV